MTRKLAFVLVAVLGPTLLSLLAACSPVYQAELPSGYLAVTSYSRLSGINGAQDTNTMVALRNCPKGFVLIEERFGTDADGLYREWTYDCVRGRQPGQARREGEVGQSRSDDEATVGGQLGRDGEVTVGPIQPHPLTGPHAARRD
jgi:hypothetical protein